VYADDVNLLGDNTDIIKKNTENVIDTRKGVGLEVNAEETNYELCVVVSAPECRVKL
jgi:hypothetical protein